MAKPVLVKTKTPKIPKLPIGTFCLLCHAINQFLYILLQFDHSGWCMKMVQWPMDFKKATVSTVVYINHPLGII